MNNRLLTWIGGVVAVAAWVAMAAYWIRVGFRVNDALGWIGALVGATGLALALSGPARERRRPRPESAVSVNERSVRVDGGSNAPIATGDNANIPQMRAHNSGSGTIVQAGRDQIINILAIPRVVWLVLMVLSLLAAGGVVVVKWVVPQFRPIYKSQFLIDATAGGSGAIAESLRKVVGNAGSRDAMALRSFGGECGSDDNTSQLVRFGTGNGTEITRAAEGARSGGKATLLRGIVQAVEDFSKPFSLGARQVNRVIVITRHGTDACDDDAAFVRREIQDRIRTAGLKVDFRVVGYQVPAGERARLRQIAAGADAGEPLFARDQAGLNAALEWFTNVEPVLRSAERVNQVLNQAVDQVEAGRTAIDGGRFAVAERHLDRAGGTDVALALEDLESRARMKQAREIHTGAVRLRDQQRTVVRSGRTLLAATRKGGTRAAELAAYEQAVKVYNDEVDALATALNALRATVPVSRP